MEKGEAVEEIPGFTTLHQILLQDKQPKASFFIHYQMMCDGEEIAGWVGNRDRWKKLEIGQISRLKWIGLMPIAFISIFTTIGIGFSIFLFMYLKVRYLLIKRLGYGSLTLYCLVYAIQTGLDVLDQLGKFIGFHGGLYRLR